MEYILGDTVRTNDMLVGTITRIDQDAINAGRTPWHEITYAPGICYANGTPANISHGSYDPSRLTLIERADAAAALRGESTEASQPKSLKTVGKLTAEGAMAVAEFLGDCNDMAPGDYDEMHLALMKRCPHPSFSRFSAGMLCDVCGIMEECELCGKPVKSHDWTHPCVHCGEPCEHAAYGFVCVSKTCFAAKAVD